MRTIERKIVFNVCNYGVYNRKIPIFMFPVSANYNQDDDNDK